MERISVFDMLKIGVGPSSSHTLGPWRAAERWIKELKDNGVFHTIVSINVDLYGSLSLTGKGHATDLAVLLGLSGADPEYVPVDDIQGIIENIKTTNTLDFAGERALVFSADQVKFNKNFLPFHSNGLTFTGTTIDNETITSTFYSIGGGFVVKEDEMDVPKEDDILFPYPIQKAKELLAYSNIKKQPISQIVLANEKAIRSEEEVDRELQRVWDTMLECMYIGCHTEGFLPGGLNVRRRAFDLHKKLKKHFGYTSKEEWIQSIRNTEVRFREILKWYSLFHY